MLEDLMRVPRISLKTAKAILQFRNKRGGIRCFNDLEEISGVGPKMIERLKLRFRI
ncbi:MAG: helix-hairpin-helix domain-containing protein [Myxococcaceae bacterium]|nr:helix-hairpin-helix domain-containing protein [Myxococcaceae bacterium]